MKKKKLMMIIIVAIVTSAVVIRIITLKPTTYNYNISRGRLTGNNDIDRLIQDIYEKDSFVDIDDAPPNGDHPVNVVDVAINHLLQSVEYNDKIYLKEDVYIEEKYIEEKIADVIGYLSDNNGELALELYSIKGVSNGVAIAVKSADNDQKYLLLNPDYMPETLEDFIEDLGLREGGTVLRICLLDYKNRYSISYVGVTMEDLLDGLLVNAENKISKELDYKIEETGLMIVISVDGTKERYNITLLENGDIKIKSLNYIRVSFSGGENDLENGINLINYVRKNSVGTLIEYN